MAATPVPDSLDVTRRYGRTLAPDGTDPGDAPAWVSGVDNPYLHGLHAPVTGEVTAETLEVVHGEVPKDLFGAYFRNGPNTVHAPRSRYHWFDGDGMVHGLWFEDGEARYRNRWVRTKGLAMEAERGGAIWNGILGPFDFSLPGGPLKDTANTDVLPLGGKLAALWYESGRVHILDPGTLETQGVERFGGELRMPVSAHSKTDPRTGDFLVFGCSERPPHLRYGVVRPDGVVHQTDITLPGRRFPHDLGFTPSWTVLHDFPVFYDQALFERTGKRYAIFQPDTPTRYGVLPRFGTDADVRWFEFAPCYMLHVVNCWEEQGGDELVMVGCRQPDPSLRPDRRDGPIAAMLSGLRLRVELHEWRMNLRTGESSERVLDTLNAEFPMSAPQVQGVPSRWAYSSILPDAIPVTFDALVKHDITTGEVVARHDYGPGIFGSEAPFAPRAGADLTQLGDRAEDDGYLVTFTTDVSQWVSHCEIFHAQALDDGPICKLRLPNRLPAGFHATWMAGEQGAVWA